MVGYANTIYVFGGEVGFSNGVETPLWMYDITVSRILYPVHLYQFLDLRNSQTFQFSYTFHVRVSSRNFRQLRDASVKKYL